MLNSTLNIILNLTKDINETLKNSILPVRVTGH